MVFARRSEPERPGGPPGYRYESVVPLAGNRSLVGFDMAAQEANLRALLRARDIDRPVMSAAFPLRQPVDDAHAALGVRSEERRVGKECGSPCRSWWSPAH